MGFITLEQFGIVFVVALYLFLAAAIVAIVREARAGDVVDEEAADNE